MKRHGIQLQEYLDLDLQNLNKMIERTKSLLHKSTFLQHHPEQSDDAYDKFAGIPMRRGPGERRSQGERLTDQERDELLSGVLNSESKMIVLGGMVLNTGLFASGDLDTMIRDLQRGQKGWKISTGIPFGYCLNSFADIGLVAKDEIIDDRNTIGYKATERGKDALPIIGHLLDYSLKHPDIAMQKVFSVTGSSGKEAEEDFDGDTKQRAPKKRIRILKTLLEAEGSLREIDVREAIGARISISPHLDNLAKTGLITYTSREADSGVTVKYKVTEGDKPDIFTLPRPEKNTQRTLTERVRFVVTKLQGEISTNAVYNTLLTLFPQYAARSEPTLRNAIMGDLHALSLAGYLEKGETTKDKQSDASLNDTQREQVAELIHIVDKFQEGDPQFLAEGQQKANAILRNPESVAKLMRKAQISSHNALALGPEELKGRIMDLVRTGDGTITSTAVVQHLDKRISRPHAARLLRDLHLDGKLDIEKIGQGIKYKANLTDNEGLPDDIAGLQAAESSLQVELAPFTQGLQLLLAAYRSHSDPQSPDALQVLEQIKTVRADKHYKELLEKRDAIQERLNVIVAENTGVDAASQPMEDEEQQTPGRRTRPTSPEVIAFRERIDAFRDFGVTDPAEIGKWMGVPRKLLARHIQIMDDQFNRALSPQKMERILKARELRDTQGKNAIEIAEIMSIEKSTVLDYLNIADDTERLENQRKMTPRQERMLRVKEMEAELPDTMTVEDKVRHMAGEMGVAMGTIYGYRRSLFDNQARFAKERDERRAKVKELFERYSDLTPRQKVIRVAEELGIAQATVYNDRDAIYGVRRKNREELQQRRERAERRMQELAESHQYVTVEQRAEMVGDELGVSGSSVFIYLRQLRRQRETEATPSTNESPRESQLQIKKKEVVVYAVDEPRVGDPDTIAEAEAEYQNQRIIYESRSKKK